MCQPTSNNEGALPMVVPVCFHYSTNKNMETVVELLGSASDLSFITGYLVNRLKLSTKAEVPIVTNYFGVRPRRRR